MRRINIYNIFFFLIILQPHQFIFNKTNKIKIKQKNGLKFFFKQIISHNQNILTKFKLNFFSLQLLFIFLKKIKYVYDAILIPLAAA